jgi:hypothetical protein
MGHFYSEGCVIDQALSMSIRQFPPLLAVLLERIVVVPHAPLLAAADLRKLGAPNQIVVALGALSDLAAPPLVLVVHRQAGDSSGRVKWCGQTRQVVRARSAWRVALVISEILRPSGWPSWQ